MNSIVIRSAAVVLGAAIVAVGVAAILALATFGRNRFSSRFQFALVGSSLLLPSYVVAGAWSAGFGSMGWWTLSQVTAAKAPLVGIASVIWIHAMAATPVAFGLLVIGLQRCSATMVELAKMEGGAKRQFWVGIMPSWSVWIVGVFFLVAAWVSGDMVVTNLFQVTTLTEQCYLDRLAGELSWTRILAACSLSVGLGVAGVATLARIWSRDRRERQPGYRNQASLGSDWLGVVVGGCIVAIVTGIPLANLIIKAGWQATETHPGTIQRSWDIGFVMKNVANVPLEYAEELRWSLSLAGWSATLATLVAAFFVFFLIPTLRHRVAMDARAKGNGFAPVAKPSAVSLITRETGFTDRSSDHLVDGRYFGQRQRAVVSLGSVFGLLLVAFALPGPIVSGMVIWVFQLPIFGLAWLNDHTLAAPILCLQFRLIPLAFFTLSILDRQWQDRVGDLWKIDRAKAWHARFRLYLFGIFEPACAIWGLLFAIAFGDLSSYLPCLPPGVTPVSMRIFDLLHYGVRSSEAALLLFLALAGTAIGWFGIAVLMKQR